MVKSPHVPMYLLFLISTINYNEAEQNIVPPQDPAMETPRLSLERGPQSHPRKWVQGSQLSSLYHPLYNRWNPSPHLSDTTHRYSSWTWGTQRKSLSPTQGGQNAEGLLDSAGGFQACNKSNIYCSEEIPCGEGHSPAWDSTCHSRASSSFANKRAPLKKWGALRFQKMP